MIREPAPHPSARRSRFALLAGLAIFALAVLAALPASAAHRNIVVSDSLLANADQLKVKMGAQWMGIHKWRVGDYAVVSSKLGWTTTSTTTNLFKTRTASARSTNGNPPANRG